MQPFNPQHHGNTITNYKYLKHRDLRGGGNYLTQSEPTNFHGFWKRKILTEGETVADYREVTASEKATLEAADAKWKKPEQWVIDRFNYHANRLIPGYGGYNEATGFGELGTVKDLTAADMLDILLSPQGIHFVQIQSSDPNGFMRHQRVRALFPISISDGGGGYANFLSRYQGCRFLEEAIFKDGYYIGQASRAFYGCGKLRILSFPETSPITELSEMFTSCVALEELTPPNFAGNISLSESSKLSLASIKRLIERAAAGKGITITLHHDAYARVTDDILAAAAAKNITIATP